MWQSHELSGTLHEPCEQSRMCSTLNGVQDESRAGQCILAAPRRAARCFLVLSGSVSLCWRVVQGLRQVCHVRSLDVRSSPSCVFLCARIGVFVFSLSLRLAHRCILRYPPLPPHATCFAPLLTGLVRAPVAFLALEQYMSRCPSKRGRRVYAISFPCDPRSGARLIRLIYRAVLNL